MTPSELRSAFLDFMAEKGHKITPSASLLPENDPTTLFTGSGMQPMLPYLLGEKHPLGTRIADSQKCFRAGDLDEVGDNRHTTFFEMLGNWSLGDYFKSEQIDWMWEFLVERLGVDPTKLYVTCHEGSETAGIARDNEAASKWQKLFEAKGIEAKIGTNPERDGMRPGERIFFYEDKKNWWSRAGVPGKMPAGEPGGPDSEMFWDFDPTGAKGLHAASPWASEPCHVNCDCGRFLEIGNNVFMAYRKREDGTFEELAGKNIDFGGGLERIAMALEDEPDIFKTGVFTAARAKLAEISGEVYAADAAKTGAMRVILDHLRAATFLIGDGALPSNVDAGYFTRRLIRRAIRAGRKLGLEKDFTGEMAAATIETYADAYSELGAKRAEILAALTDEEAKFRKTLERGEREIEKLLASGTSIDGAKAFWLFETYGFPREMTEEAILEHLAKGHGGTENFANLEILREKLFAENPALEADLKKFETEFDAAAKAHAEASRTASAGKFKGGLADHSEETTALHTAAHLLLAGLRKVLGPHVEQRGSNITAERLRFDFSHPEKVTREQLDEVEKFVNDAVKAGAARTETEMEKEAARESGATGAFWEKYPPVVKVFEFRGGDGAVWSREICGGPHVENTASLGHFRIKKEESSSAGVRRIKAILEK